MQVDTGAFAALQAEVTALRHALVWRDAFVRAVEDDAEARGYERGRAARRPGARGERPAYLQVVPGGAP